MRKIACRGIRGATTVEANTSEAILQATRELLALMIRQNGVDKDDAMTVFFSMTPDLDAEYPALAARQLGWLDTALLCLRELDVRGSLPRCIRILIQWNTEKRPEEIIHVYLKEAARLRPDRSELPPVDWQELDQWITDHLNENARSSVQHATKQGGRS